MGLVLLLSFGLRVHHRHHSQLHLGAARAVIPLLCLHRLLVIIAPGMSSTFTHTPEIPFLPSSYPDPPLCPNSRLIAKIQLNLCLHVDSGVTTLRYLFPVRNLLQTDMPP